MITFITWLRCLAAMLITNAHYTGIYPTDLIANGGLIGDIIFFCVSGYCLTNLRTSFWKWYGKRLSRILPVVFLISAIYLLVGQYDFSIYAAGTEKTVLYQILSSLGIGYPKWLSWFVYPTYYHFVASILVLYIPYYFILKTDYTRNHILAVMGAICCVYVVLYILVYDKSSYHIDTVREPFIRFLFMESMLLGAWFKLKDDKFRNKGKFLWYAVGTGGLFVIYFLSKISFARGGATIFQIINQFIIFCLLVFIMRWFSSMDMYFEKAPKWLYGIVNLIAKQTLEIYLVQYVLIDVIRGLDLPFPLNWIMLTMSIMAAAFVLHAGVEIINKMISTSIGKIKKRRDKEY